MNVNQRVFSHILQPYQLKHLRLKNRIAVTAHAPGYAERGMLGDRLQRYHLEQARGGAGLIMFGGSSSVSADGLGSFGMLDVSSDEMIGYFQDFSRKVHDEGAVTMCQITHMGRRARWDSGLWTTPIGPSRVKEPAHRAYPRVATIEDIRRIVVDFGKAARRCQEGGLDGVELAFHSQQMAAQFWSKGINQREDEYGGDLDNRMRFSLEVIDEVRRVVGPDFLVSVRMSADELIASGLNHQECLEIAARLARTGKVDFLNILGSQAGDWKSAAASMANMSFPEAPYLHLAAAVRQVAGGIPVLHAQRILTFEKAEEAIASGSVDLVGMTRSHVADPQMVAKLQSGRMDEIRPCVGANYCINRIYTAGEMLCLHNPATGREAAIPHTIPRAEKRRKVVVIGAGPGGLEAARVSAERGHDVTLYEAGERCGGQVLLASSTAWRGALGQVTQWLEHEVRRLGVDVRLSTWASEESVLADHPDIVVVATGGRQSKLDFAGDRVTTPADFIRDVKLAGKPLSAYEGTRITIFDNVGNHKALSVAEDLAEAGALVELITPERYVGIEVGNNDMPIHSERLYRMGVTFTTDHLLKSVVNEDNSVVCTLSNVFTNEEARRESDLLIVEDGTVPEDGLFASLRSRSFNRGQIDYEALRENRPQQLPEEDGEFMLFAVGDAVSSRNIHAALYDSIRLLKDI
ncbi:oxidoreductase [Aureimonas psammosilenae]|uniref:oxidoreductase n=1 Tax=Aureimonas psammosilenae TaxID=2495496 RepID=UPI0012608C22|nr:FAD-dependent oxidoreductase [Aureimonas psammosilenae]